MALSTSAAKTYLLASAVVLPAPYMMPLTVLFPPPPEKMIVWPMVVLGSAPLAVIGVLLAALHERHKLALPSVSVAARAWSAAAVLTFSPLWSWLPPGAGVHLAGVLAALVSAGASIAFAWLARDLWRLRLPGRWWVLVACVQIALLFGTLALNWVDRRLAISGTLLDLSETPALFALDCALVGAVLVVALAAAWWQQRHTRVVPAG